MAASVMGCILLAEGCFHTESLTSERTEIRFEAGSALLQDDAKRTKATLKTGTEFSPGDQFLAWAWHSAAQQNLSFGTDTPVTLSNTGLWDYEPHNFWNWQGSNDYYDFLAISPAGESEHFSHQAATLSNPYLRTTVQYDATEEQYDLLSASCRRNDKTINAVHLDFSHRLSAVSVEVVNSVGSVNNAGNPLTITLLSCRFVNLLTSASISIKSDGNNQEVSISGDRSTTPVLGPPIPADTELAPGYGYPSKRIIDRLVSWLESNSSLNPQDRQDLVEQVYDERVWEMGFSDIIAWINENGHLSGESLINNFAKQIYREDEWDLMIPQNLNPEVPPSLQIVYNMGDLDDVTQEIPLKEIRNQVTGDAITEWRAGIQYHYQIELRIGVGIVVTVTTTPWEIVEAETPGLMI